MSLREQFLPDLENVFLVKSEFAQLREFAIVEDGEEIVFTSVVHWDTEILKTRAIVQQQGLYLGSVLCIIKKYHFLAEPRPEQIIYTPVTPFRIGWRIVDCTDAEEAYDLSLDKLIA